MPAYMRPHSPSLHLPPPAAAAATTGRWRVCHGGDLSGGITALVFSPEASREGGQRLLACTGRDGALRVIDFDAQELVVSTFHLVHVGVHICWRAAIYCMCKTNICISASVAEQSGGAVYYRRPLCICATHASVVVCVVVQGQLCFASAPLQWGEGTTLLRSTARVWHYRPRVLVTLGLVSLLFLVVHWKLLIPSDRELRPHIMYSVICAHLSSWQRAHCFAYCLTGGVSAVVWWPSVRRLESRRQVRRPALLPERQFMLHAFASA
jgi:hypothetical protein